MCKECTTAEMFLEKHDAQPKRKGYGDGDALERQRPVDTSDFGQLTLHGLTELPAGDLAPLHAEDNDADGPINELREWIGTGCRRRMPSAAAE